MKIERTIKRTIRLTPTEVYAALVDKYDLPPATEIRFDMEQCFSDELVLIAADESEEER